MVCPNPIGSAVSSYARLASASSMNRWRGTFRIRSSTRLSAIPCSWSRCTSRSRVRAEVMPIPLSRGPSMKLLKFQPLLHCGYCRMARQIDLQGSDGRIPVRHGMKVRARSRILAGTGVTHPIDIAAARIFRLHDRLAAMAAAQASHLDSPQPAVRKIRHIDIENDGTDVRPLQRFFGHSTYELRGHLRRSGKIARTPRLDAQRHRDGGETEKPALDRGRHRSRIQGVVAEIGSVIDPRHDDVVLEVEQAGNRQMYAIGRRAVDVVGVGVITGGAHRHIESERVAGAAAIPIRGHDGDGAKGPDRRAERVQALCTVAVIIREKNFHWS